MGGFALGGVPSLGGTFVGVTIGGPQGASGPGATQQSTSMTGASEAGAQAPSGPGAFGGPSGGANLGDVGAPAIQLDPLLSIPADQVLTIPFKLPALPVAPGPQPIEPSPVVAPAPQPVAKSADFPFFEPQPFNPFDLMRPIERQPQAEVIPTFARQLDLRPLSLDVQPQPAELGKPLELYPQPAELGKPLEISHGGDAETVAQDLARGDIPRLTGADPPQIPDLDQMLMADPTAGQLAPRFASESARTDSGAPCLSCQMTDEERSQLLDSLPPDAVEVSFMCPTAEDAENLSRGMPNGCIPN